MTHNTDCQDLINEYEARVAMHPMSVQLFQITSKPRNVASQELPEAQHFQKVSKVAKRGRSRKQSPKAYRNIPSTRLPLPTISLKSPAIQTLSKVQTSSTKAPPSPKATVAPPPQAPSPSIEPADHLPKPSETRILGVVIPEQTQ